METMYGNLYLPTENIYYALSLLGHKLFDDANFKYRLSAFAELIESIILSNRLVYDLDEAVPIFNKEIIHFIDKFNLKHIFLPKHPSSVPFLDHAPALLAESSSFVRELETKLKNKSITEKEAGHALMKCFSDKMAVESMTAKINEIVDFMWIVYSSLYEEESTNETEDLYVSHLMEFKAVFREDVIKVFYKNELPSEQKERFIFLMCFLFHACTESAFRATMRDGYSLCPLSLQSDVLLSKPIFSPSSRVFLNKLNDEKYKDLAILNDFLFNKYTRLINIPLLFNYVLSHANSIPEIIEVALELRDKKETRRYREWCAELDQALHEGDQNEAIQMIGEANHFIENICKKTNTHSKFQLQISFPPAIILDIPYSKSFTRKNHLLLLKQVFQDARNPLLLESKIHKIFGIRNVKLV